jgi:hypothetical protein
MRWVSQLREDGIPVPVWIAQLPAQANNSIAGGRPTSVIRRP